MAGACIVMKLFVLWSGRDQRASAVPQSLFRSTPPSEVLPDPISMSFLRSVLFVVFVVILHQSQNQ